MTIILMTQDLCDQIAEAWTLKHEKRVWITLRPKGGVTIQIQNMDDPDEAMAVGAYLLRALLQFFASECDVGDLIIIPGLTPE